MTIKLFNYLLPLCGTIRIFPMYNPVAKRVFLVNRQSIIVRSIRRYHRQQTPAFDAVSRSLSTIGSGRRSLGILASASIGTMCMYGLASGKRTEASATEKSSLWPDYIRSRVRNTFTYLTASLAVTAGSAVVVLRSPVVMFRILSQGSLMFTLGSYAAVIGSGMILHALPYCDESNERLSISKHLAWLMHAGLLGIFLAPMTYLGGPVLVTAAWYTAGLTAALAATAACSPSHQFINWSGPLSIGLAAVFISSLGSAIVSPLPGFIGMSLYSISTYGGLVIFSGLLLYDTQKIAHRAESIPPLGSDYQLTHGKYDRFDPINESTAVFLDILNIFVRIAMTLANFGGSGIGKRDGRGGKSIGFGSGRKR